EQTPERAAVHGQVMDREKEDWSLRTAPVEDRAQDLFRQVEGPVGGLCQLGEQILFAPARGIDLGENGGWRRAFALERAPVALAESGAQGRMPGHQSEQDAAEGTGLGGDREARREGDVVGRTLRRQALDEPDGLLDGREWQLVRSIRRRELREG